MKQWSTQGQQQHECPGDDIMEPKAYVVIRQSNLKAAGCCIPNVEVGVQESMALDLTAEHCIWASLKALRST